MLSKLQIINEIGHGSFGNVKKVRNKKNNKIFALKEIELNSRLELNKNLKEKFIFNSKSICGILL